MGTVLVTGVSGTGKSTVLRELAARGHRTVDTDSDQWNRWVTNEQGAPDWIWREEEIRPLLVDHVDGHLFVSGCKTNQGRYYSLFDAIVVLSAPTEVILERLSRRTTNDYGKSAEERRAILWSIRDVEPLLVRSATDQIVTTVPVAEVADRLERIADSRSGDEQHSETALPR